MSAVEVCNAINEAFEHFGKGRPCKLKNVEARLPIIKSALEEQGIKPTKQVMMAVIATIGVETGVFYPIKEYGGTDYYNKMYDTGERAKNLGNTTEADGDGAKWCGRGDIQLTGYANYLAAEKALGIPLTQNPDLALDPVHSVRILVWYMKSRSVQIAAQAEMWVTVRKKVNGGRNGLDIFLRIIQNLSNVEL